MKRKYFFSLIAVFSLFNNPLIADDFSIYENLNTGDIIKENSIKTKTNKNYLLEEENYKIKDEPLNDEIKYKNNLMGYSIIGKYSNNSENKDKLFLIGIYDLLYSVNSSYSFEFDVEYSYIKNKDKTEKDTKQNDFTFKINKKLNNNYYTSLALHYTGDNKDTKVHAGQYQISRYFYFPKDKAGLLPYLKFSVERYKYDDAKTNNIWGLKLGNTFSLYGNNWYLNITPEIRYHIQNGDKFTNTSKSFKGFYLKNTYKYKNLINQFNFYIGNEVGTLNNDGFVIFNSTNKIEKSYELKSTYLFNKNDSLSVSYKKVYYKILENLENTNVSLFGVFYQKNY